MYSRIRSLIVTSNGSLAAVGLIILSLAWAASALAATEFMQVPVQGELVANPVKVAVGNVTVVTFTVVPTRTLSRLKLSILIPAGVEQVGGDLAETYSDVKANEAIELQVRLAVIEDGPKRVAASASVYDSDDFALNKAFVVDLNPGENHEPPTTRTTDADGGKIRVQTIPKD